MHMIKQIWEKIKDISFLKKLLTFVALVSLVLIGVLLTKAGPFIQINDPVTFITL